MPLNVLRYGTYDRKAWKNGGGITEDVRLFPESATHDDFEIRLSLAEISREGPFSAFAGIDRTITLVGGDPFLLEFDDGTRQRMTQLAPFSFDGALTPVSRLDGAPSRDFNVMTRRGRWTHLATIQRGGEGASLQLDGGAIGIVHAVTGKWRAAAGNSRETLGPRDTLIASGEPGLILEADAGSAAILAILKPHH